ncbi:MAG: EF-hand domain-containing protein, partial [Dichotomicrobium sp.]
MRGMGMGPGWRMGMFEQVDANDDGRVSAEEAEAFWTEQMETYDSDGDGTLSLEEFAEMHAAHTRPMTVDRFQAFDEDGDGKVTKSELEAPSRRMVRMMERFENDAAGPGNMRGRRGRGAGMMREQ